MPSNRLSFRATPLALAIAGALAMGLAAPHAKAQSFPAVVPLSSLDGSNGFRALGEAEDDWFGYSVSTVGDINGDGLDDLVIGANRADPAGLTLAGSSYVVFGRDSPFPGTISPSSLNGSNGFRLDGGSAGDRSGFSVAAAGDVNGDGVDDLVVSAPMAGPIGAESGSSYVIFGSVSGFPATLDLSQLNGANGFRLDGAVAGDASGFSVSAAGDINDDLIDDLVIGAEGADPGGRDNAGCVYVVFGKTSSFAATFDLSSLDGTDGFRLDGAAAADRFGFSVARAGDVNGDGRDDLVAGAPVADNNGNASGAAYVIFGKSTPFAASMNVASLDGTAGFRIDGAGANNWSGFSVRAAGDVNGNGIDDLIIGGPFANSGGIDRAGSAHVLFGRNTGFGAVLNLSTLDGSNGFRLNGELELDYAGYAVSAAGDINGDGIDDVIVGAPGVDADGRGYVIYGKASAFPASIGLASLNGTDGFRIDGETTPGAPVAAARGMGDIRNAGIRGATNTARAGYAVGPAGDVNADGIDDLLVGSPTSDANGVDSGSAHVLFGRLATPSIAIGNATVTEGNAGTSSATFTVRLSKPVAGGFTLPVSSNNGTALAGSDYVAIPGGSQLTFAGAAGETQAVSVTVNSDSVLEPDETFTVNLGTPSTPAVSVTRAQGRGTIVNDDSASIAINDVVITEGDAGTIQADFTVALTGSVQGGFTVPVTSANGSATAGSDYVGIAPGAQLSFAGTVGETQTQSIAVNGELVVEGDETYVIQIGTPSDPGIGVSDASGTGTITNDDNAVVAINSIALAEGDSGATPFLLTVTLDAEVQGGFTVPYQTADGTALAASDYAPASGALSFSGSMGQTRTVAVAVTGDTTPEAAETFHVDLGAPSLAAVSANPARGTATIVNDDLIADISVANSNGVNILLPGQMTTYTVVVTNTSQVVDVPGVQIVQTLPAELSNVSWTCVAAGGAICPASGSGAVSTTLALPRTSSVTYQVTATLAPSSNVPTIVATVSGSLASPYVDPNPANNIASDSDATGETVFRNGFE